MATHHDQLMKELIATFPDQFLRLAAPEIAERIDLGTVRFEPEEHYPGGPTGREQRPDLVSRARARAAGELSEAEELLLHVEIELEFRRRKLPRLLRYQRGLSLKYALPVHTLVLYLHGGPAGAQYRDYEERSLGLKVGGVSYWSLGLSRMPAAEYLARPEPLAWAFASLMRPARGRPRSKLGLDCVVRIAGERGLRKRERDLLLACVLTYADFDDDDALEFGRILNELEDEEVLDVRMSMTERWRREGLEMGRREGRQEGRQEGRREGRAEGVRDLVLRLLRQRFGSLSSEVQRRVASIASADELSRLAEKVYQVESLEELGLA